MRYGMASIMPPPNTIINIIGFWNIPTILKDWGGMKKLLRWRGVSLIGYGSWMGEGGLSGVPATYGRTSGTSED